MSHNKTTVGGNAPNTDGEIAVALSDLSDVSISGAAIGQLVQYNSSSSQFENTTSAAPYGIRGAGAAAGSNTIATFALLAIPNPYHSGYTYFWEFAAKKQAGSNRIAVVSDSNSQLVGNAYGSATTWLDHVQFLTAGTYYLWAMVHIGESSASGSSLDVSWADGSYSPLGPRVRVQRFDEKRIIVRCIYEASINDVAGLYMHATSGACYTQSTYINYLISVEKIS
jgi:hypothetical protein